MQNYDKISTAIHYILDHQSEQLTLDDIARSIHLTPFHFQKLFSQWAGASPNQLLAILTLKKTRQQIPRLQDISALHLSPYSSPYDHVISLKAVTPTQTKLIGEDLDINYGFHQCDVGSVFIASTKHGICLMAFSSPNEKVTLITRLKRDWPNAVIKEDHEQTRAYAHDLFKQQGKGTSPLSLLVKGTHFQIQVWQALLNIPFGQAVSYFDIATAIGKPKAVRAVGTAIGKNPIAFYIPCHRVLQKSGALGGYHWGVEKKYALLVKEAALKE